ncbi:MAG: hypothetical protein K2W82_13590 [Candidatus Obscuribacterales bacterium]|nr:hypothetical protein [Candidatus Obscuribacterales bacterium]
MNDQQVAPSQSLIEEPQGLCDLVTCAFRVWRQNIRLIIKVLAVPSAVTLLCATVTVGLLIYGLEEKTPDLAIALLLFFIGVLCAVGCLVAACVTSIRNLALIRYLCGSAASWEEANGYMRKKFWWLVGLMGSAIFALVLIFCFWGFLLGFSLAMAKYNPLFIIVASLFVPTACVGAGVSMLIFFLVTAIGAAVVCLEDLDFAGVIRRSFYWTFHYFGRLVCFSIVFYTVIGIVSAPIKFPVLIMSLVDLAARDLFHSVALKPSIYMVFFEQFWTALSAMLLQPVTLLSFGFFYLDLRNRAEGSDLARRLAALKQPVADGI